MRVKVAAWKNSNASDFGNDEQTAKAEKITELMDDLLIDLSDL